MSILYLAIHKPDYKSRGFFVILAVLSAVFIFGMCCVKALSLYFVRYLRPFEIRSELNKLDELTLSDNALLLENERINGFWKMHTFFVAEPFDERSKRLFLGVASLT